MTDQPSGLPERARSSDDATIREAMAALDDEAKRLDTAAMADAYPQSPRARTKRQRAEQLRLIWGKLDRLRSTLASRGVSAEALIAAMERDGNAVLFVWHSGMKPHFRKVPVEAVADAIRRAFSAAAPPVAGQVLPLKPFAGGADEQ